MKMPMGENGNRPMRTPEARFLVVSVQSLSLVPMLNRTRSGTPAT